MVEARKRDAKEYHFEVNGTKMIVDFEQMLQTNVKSGKRRPVRFGVPEISVHEHCDVGPSSVFVRAGVGGAHLQPRLDYSVTNCVLVFFDAFRVVLQFFRI